jgi:hypothetical protein
MFLNMRETLNTLRIFAELLRQAWNKIEWLYEGQHIFSPRYSCESQIVTICQDVADSLDEGASIDAIIIHFSRALDLVQYDRLYNLKENQECQRHRKFADRLGQIWEVSCRKWMEMNPDKSKSVSFTRSQVKNSLNYLCGGWG